MPFVHTCHLLPWKHLLSINSTILLLHHQCCIRAHGGIMQRCTMWQLEVREYALYLPPIFSLATLSRLPLDFSSGSAIFPLSLRPLVLSASSCSPFSSFLNVLFLFLLIYTLSVSLSRTHTHARARAGLSTSWFVLSLTCAHTASVTQTTIHLCLILSVSLAPILYQAHSREELNLCDAAAAAAAWAYAHSREWWDT